MNFSDTAKRIATAVFGLVIAGIGGFFLWIEMRTPPSHAGHVYLWAAFIAVGMLIIAPALLFGTLQRIVLLLAQVRAGGRRVTDPADRP